MNKRQIATLCLISALFTWNSPATAGENVWTQFGPPGGSVFDVAVDPNDSNVLYAASSSGVYKSIDQGDRWARMSDGIFSGFYGIRTIAVHPDDSNIVTATSSRMFRSEDAGMTWSQVNGFTTVHGTVNQIAFDPTDPLVVYAATDLTCIAKSVDGGLTWDRSNEGVESPRRCYDLIVDPDTPSTVYATNNAGIYKSEDSGETWVLNNDGIPSRFQLGYIALKPVAGQPPELYVTNSFGAEEGLFKSVDGGESWTPSGNGLPNNGARYIVRDAATDTLYVITADGPYLSTDGTNWTPTGDGHPKDPNTGSLAIDPSNGANLYSTNAKGIFRTTNAAGTWSRETTGLLAMTATEIEFDPGTPGAMYAGNTTAEIWKSENGGVDWSQLQFAPPIEIGYTSALEVHPDVPETLFTFDRLGDLLRSTNGGADWEEVGLGLGGSPNNLAIDPFSAEPVLESRIYVGGLNQALHVSLDSGETFSFEDVFEDARSAYEVAFDPLDSERIYAALSNEGVARSTDSGDTWEIINGDILIEPGVAYFDLDINPIDSDLVLLRGNRYLYRSTTAGDDWTLVDLEDSPQTVTIHPTNERAFLGAGGSVLLSKDGGQTFKSIGQGLPRGLFNGFVYDIEIDPDDQRRVVASIGNISLWEMTLIDPVLTATPVDIVEAGKAAVIEIEANIAPASSVTFAVLPQDDECEVSSSQIVFDADTTTQQIEVSAPDDFVIDGEQDCSVVLSPGESDDGIWDSYDPTDIVVPVADVTEAGVALDAVSPIKVVEYGASKTTQLALTSIPDQAVSIQITSSDESEAVVSPSELVFAADESALLTQTITITGVDDAEMDGAVSLNVEFVLQSADANYSGLIIGSIPVINLDDEEVVFLGDFE